MTDENKTRLYEIVKDWHERGWSDFRRGLQKKNFGDMCKEMGMVPAKYGEHVPGFIGVPYPNTVSSLNHALFISPELATKILALGYIPSNQEQET